MKTFWFPNLVKEKIMSHFGPVKTEERKVWEALTKWYVRASTMGRQHRFTLVSFRTTHLKRGGLGLFKYNCTRFAFSRRRGMSGSMEAERYWFLTKGFSEAEGYWEYWNEDHTCSLRIRKGILHAIHARRAWFFQDDGNRKWFRDCRGHRRVFFKQWHFRSRTMCSYNRNRGDFVPR